VSKRRVGALAAVIVVPVAVLAIVLATLLDDDDSGAPPARTVSVPAKRGPTGPSGVSGPSSTPAPAPGTGGAAPPGTSLSVLEKGAVPKNLGEKLDPASSDGTIALGELGDTPIVLNVWSADCTPCRGETRLLQSEWDRLGPRGVLFLGLNVLDSPAAARRFRTENGVTYPSVEEKRGTTARALGATGVPETFFISKRGKVVGHVAGAVTLGQIQLGVRAAQTGRAIPPDEGGARVPFR
jgi:peroxiredoxin